MLRFLILRIFTAVIVIFGAITVIFVLARLVGDPVALMIQPGMSEVQVNELRQALGLDRPMIEQYGIFVVNALSGDFGESPWQYESAFKLVIERLPATLLLATCGLGLSMIIAILVGTISALKRGSLIDRFAMTVVLLGQSIPNFWLGLMLILLFAVQLRWLPAAGYGRVEHIILPMVTLSLFSLARLTRLVRSELLDVMAQDYIRTARSKGLPDRVLLFRHALRNAMIPIVTVLAVDFGILVGGAVVTETIFAWPGIGRLMIQAIGQRDFPILQAAAFVVAVLVVLSNFVADLMYAWLDPRIRYG